MEYLEVQYNNAAVPDLTIPYMPAPIICYTTPTQPVETEMWGHT